MSGHQEPVEVRLKPCPFCGGEAHTAEADGKWYAGCNDCFADGLADEIERRYRAALNPEGSDHAG